MKNRTDTIQYVNSVLKNGDVSLYDRYALCAEAFEKIGYVDEYLYYLNLCNAERIKHGIISRANMIPEYNNFTYSYLDGRDEEAECAGCCAGLCCSEIFDDKHDDDCCCGCCRCCIAADYIADSHDPF